MPAVLRSVEVSRGCEAYPYGESRLTATMLTDKLFTGQRELAGLGIYHYQARFLRSAPEAERRGYSPKLGRFLSPDTIVPSYANPQSLNRYSYVYNAPINYIDPSGHDADYFCSGSNDYSSSCTGYVQDQATLGSNLGGGNGGAGGGGDNEESNEPGGTPPLPNSSFACGQAGSYSSHCSGWHFYTTGPTLVCPIEFACSEQEMIDYLARFAFPGQDPGSPIHNLDINYVSLGPISMGSLGKIQTFVSNGGLTIKNVTQPGHIFYDGIIIRKAYKGEDGAWYVRTYGYGNNRVIGMDTTNQFFGPSIFNALDQQMINQIQAHH